MRATGTCVTGNVQSMMMQAGHLERAGSALSMSQAAIHTSWSGPTSWVQRRARPALMCASISSRLTIPRSGWSCPFIGSQFVSGPAGLCCRDVVELRFCSFGEAAEILLHMAEHRLDRDCVVRGHGGDRVLAVRLGARQCRGHQCSHRTRDSFLLDLRRYGPLRGQHRLPGDLEISRHFAIHRDVVHRQTACL